MAYIGAMYPVYAKVYSYTPGSAIVYDSGAVAGTLVRVDLNIETSDARDYGDDVLQALENGVTGYSVSMEVNSLSEEVKAALLGLVPITASEGSTTVAYAVTDAGAPDVGFGWISVTKDGDGPKKFETYWCHSLKFVQQSVSSATREQSTTFGHPTVNGTGRGVYLSSSQLANFVYTKQHASLAAAKSWLNSRAGIA